MSGIYRDSICVEIDDDPEAETAREVEVEFEAEMTASDDGLEAEILYAWDGAEEVMLSVEQQESIDLAMLVGEQAFDSAYCIGQVKPGRYTQARHRSGQFGILVGPYSTEVLGVCGVPGRFDWLVICRDINPPLGLTRLGRSDDTGGFVLRDPGEFVGAPVQGFGDDLDTSGMWVEEAQVVTDDPVG